MFPASGDAAREVSPEDLGVRRRELAHLILDRDPARQDIGLGGGRGTETLTERLDGLLEESHLGLALQEVPRQIGLGGLGPGGGPPHQTVTIGFELGVKLQTPCRLPRNAAFVGYFSRRDRSSCIASTAPSPASARRRARTLGSSAAS